MLASTVLKAQLWQRQPDRGAAEQAELEANGQRTLCPVDFSSGGSLSVATVSTLPWMAWKEAFSNVALASLDVDYSTGPSQKAVQQR